MKKIKKVILCFMLIFACGLTVVPSIQADAAALSKVRNIQVERPSGKQLTVRWSKVKGAKGYQVYMKTNKGKFKKIATTRKKAYRVKNLKLNNSYCFKVRAYKKQGKRIVYGRYSDIVKKKMKASVNMFDVISPYYGGNFYEIHDFNIGGINYKKGYYCFSREAYFNLQNKYTKMTFTWGSELGTESTISIYGDDELLGTYTFEEADFPKNVTVDLRGVYKLKIVEEEGSCIYVNPKLYY